MDYYKIGQKIRSYRKEMSLSQEELAELIGISVTHMSHIETGNTKLSLAVFVKATKALNVSADSLLFEFTDNENMLKSEMCQILVGCSEEQSKIIIDIAYSAKISLKKHHK